MEERRSTGLEMITVGRDRVSRSMLAGTATCLPSRAAVGRSSLSSGDRVRAVHFRDFHPESEHGQQVCLRKPSLPVRPKQSIHLYRYFNTMLPPLI